MNLIYNAMKKSMKKLVKMAMRQIEKAEKTKGGRVNNGFTKK